MLDYSAIGAKAAQGAVPKMRVTVHGVQINYKIDGVEGAPCVTLSHALATNLELWDPVIPCLSKYFRVLRYDIRGHGGSEATTPPYSMEMLAGDVIGLLDALEIDRTHFIGVSLGGIIGLHLAVNAPDRLLSAVVCDARASATESYRAAWESRLREVRERGIGAVADSSLARWFTPETRSREPAIVETARRMIGKTSPDGYAGAACALMEVDLDHRLPEIRVPLLYLVGHEDVSSTPEMMVALQKRTPGSRYVAIPSAGHLPMIERPELFLTPVIGFLRETAGVRHSIRLGA